MKPPHANPEHPSFAAYNPALDDYPDEEDEIERLWRQQGGICPETGRMWLTPRMHRNSIELAKHFSKS